MFGSIVQLMRRYPMTSFFVMAFAWSWLNDVIGYYLIDRNPGLFSLSLTRTWGPLIAVLLVLKEKGSSIKEWWDRVSDFRVPVRWYIAAIALPFMLGEVRTLIHWISGADLEFQGYPPLLVLLNFFVVLLLGGALEEFGWRDYAQKHLQKRFSVILVAMFVGLMWTFWHAPLFFLYDLPSYQTDGFLVYLITVVGLSLIFTWVYNGSGGRVLIPMVAHATANLPSFFSTSGGVSESVATVADIVHPISFGLVGIVLLWWQGSSKKALHTSEEQSI